MVFSSFAFLFLFCPIFLCIYFLLPDRSKNFALFLGSVVFYVVGSYKNPLHIAVFLVSLIVNFCVAKRLSKNNECQKPEGKRIRKESYRKLLFTAALVFDLLMLATFKYSRFIKIQAKEVLGITLPSFMMLALPIGISFYSFQAISYLCDVYKGKCNAEKSFVRFGAYFTMFPQLIAGPIVTYPSVEKSLQNRKVSGIEFIEGTKVFLVGLGSKVLLANRIGGLWNQVQTIGFESVSTPLAWMGIFAFSFQLYFDFMGYSFMAVGLGKMLGFTFPKNFDYPYLSKSFTEFWRRWHMTLGAWFREYVYIPLGGSKNGTKKTVRNLFIVWFLTGIWHGAGWNYAIWGFTLFVFMLIERLGLKKILDSHPVAGHLYMIFFVPLTWAVFAVTDLEKIGQLFARLFPFGNTGIAVYAEDYIKYGKQYGIYLILCILFSTKLPENLFHKIKKYRIEVIVYLGIFWWVFYCLYHSMNDPFLYFQF